MSEHFEEIWPTFEIKIRSLISELLEPSLSKFKSTESMQSKLVKLQQEVKDRVSDVESKLHIVNSRIPVVDPINKRVAEQTIRISSFEIDLKSQIEGLRTQLDSLSSSLGSMSSQIFSQSKQNENFRKSLLDYAAGYGTLKKYIEDKVSVIKGDAKHPFELQAELNVRVENQLRQIEKNLEVLSKEVSFVDFTTKKTQHDLKAGLNVFETKNSELDNWTNKIVEQMNQLRKNINDNDLKYKNELKVVQDETTTNLNLFREEFSKVIDLHFIQMMDFVLIEPRYKKKLEQLMKDKNLEPVESVKKLKKKTIRPALGQFRSSENLILHLGAQNNTETKLKTAENNENIENIENIEKFRSFSERLIPKPPDCHLNIIQTDESISSQVSVLTESEKFELNPNNDLILEDLQLEQEKLTKKIEDILNMTEEKFNEHQNKFTLIKTLILAVKHNLDMQLLLVHSSIEKEIKPWVLTLIETGKKELEEAFLIEDDKRKLEITKIQENSEELGTILKQSSFEFSNFVSNRKRENNDVKLDLKRLYSKIEVLTKELHKCTELNVQMKNSIKFVRDFFSMQVSLSRSEDSEKKEEKKWPNKLVTPSGSSKTFKSDLLEKQEHILESLNSFLEVPNPVTTQTSLTQRSFTPELPFLRRH